MIHAEDYLVADREEVSRLAVTVVDDRIKKNDRTECNATSIYRINCRNKCIYCKCENFNYCIKFIKCFIGNNRQ